MTLTLQCFSLERMLKSNPRAHSLYMHICKDCDESGSVHYGWREIKEIGKGRKNIEEDLILLSDENLLQFMEDRKGFFIRLTSE